MIYLLDGLGATIWLLIIVKASLEFRYTLQNYNEDVYVEGSIIRTHQNLSGLIFIIAAAVSTLIAQFQYYSLLAGMYGSGMWVTALLIRLMFLYQVEMYRQERTELFTRVGIIRMISINFKRNNGKAITVDKDK